jgi:hypothetical protein
MQEASMSGATAAAAWLASKQTHQHGYALIANEFIDTMNTSLKTTFADVNVSPQPILSSAPTLSPQEQWSPFLSTQPAARIE